MEMTKSISASELETVRAHTASRLPRVLDEPPNPLSAVVVFRKESPKCTTAAKGDLKSATTKKTADVAPPYSSTKFPFACEPNSRQVQCPTITTTLPPKTHPLLLSSNISSAAAAPSQQLLQQKLISSKPISQYQLLRPHRRLARSKPCVLETSCAKTVPTVPKLQRTRRKTTTDSNLSCHRKEKIKYSPPLSMVTQGFYSTSSPTTSWVAQQSRSPGGNRATSFNYEIGTLFQNSIQAPTSRSYSQSPSTDKVHIPMSLDTDSCRSDPITARSANNLDTTVPNKTLQQYDETNSDESDLYLMAAKEEGLHQQLSMKSSVTPRKSRQSRIRYDLLPPNAKFDSVIPLRHGSDCEQFVHLDTSNKPELYRQAADNSAGEVTFNMDQINYGNTCNGHIKSNSTMSKDQNLKLYSSDQSSTSVGRRLLVSSALQQNYSSGRRSSFPDSPLYSRAGNRQLKGFSAPHTYYSSPLVPRATEVQEISELGRQVEDTESTNSTTVQSTVWDELDDLKSRIHRLESSGKLPPTIGTENFRASSERPLTATTTVTTMSTSPRRDRANSKSSTEQNLRASGGDTSLILKSALIKSKTFLDPDIYRVLEVTASDAISLSSMIGNLGQPSILTHAKVSPYPPTTSSDRQVRRKAESICRSLTELCLALSEKKNLGKEKSDLNKISHEIENQSTLESSNLPSSRLSPRPLSQLEVRRSNLLAPTTAQPPNTLPDFENSKATPFAGRRSSLFFRSGRSKFDGFPEENEERTRAPSRVFSEVNSTRNSLREKIYPFNLSEKIPSTTSESILPLRRHNSSASYSSSPIPSLSSFNRWRKSDHNQTERNRVTSSIVSRVIEDQEHGQSSFIESPTLESSHSLTRRTRNLSPNDFTSAGQRIGFH